MSIPGEVKVFKDLNEPVAGQDVLLVEDIVDSGRTTEVLLRLLQVRNPASKTFRYYMK